MEAVKMDKETGGKIEAKGIKWELGDKASSEFQDAPAPSSAKLKEKESFEDLYKPLNGGK